MVIVLRFELKLTLLPATKDMLEELPLSVNPPPPPPAAALMVIFGLVDSWLRVMFGPATRPKAVEDAVFTVPEVVPPAIEAIEYNTDWLLAEIVIVEAACPIPMLAPAEIDRLPLDPLSEVTTEGVVAEIVRLCAPPPMLMIPAPETFRRPENVPEELMVVLPKAVKL